MTYCYSGVSGLSTGSLSLIWSQQENFAFISSVVDCVNVNRSARLNHVLRDEQKVCALTKVGTVLNLAKMVPACVFNKLTSVFCASHLNFVRTLSK